METSTIKKWAMIALVAVSITACKKDNPGTEPPKPVEVVSIAITDLKALSTSASVEIPDGRKISGTVISDRTQKNIEDDRSLVLQEGADKPAILVQFSANHSFALGDQLEINISKNKLDQVNGEVWVTGVTPTSATKTGTGEVPPRSTDIAAVRSNASTWNGTLVKINATELSSMQGTYIGSLKLKDDKGELSSKIFDGAVFEGNKLLASISSLTGIVRGSGDNVRIDLRKESDAVIGDVTRVLVENFSVMKHPTYPDMPSMQVDGPLSQPIADLGQWVVGNFRSGIAYVRRNVPGDENITERDRPYIYLPKNDRITTSPGSIGPWFDEENSLKGLKRVSVTFTHSLATSFVRSYHRTDDRTGSRETWVYAPETILDPLTPFTTGDKVNIEVYLSSPALSSGNKALTLLNDNDNERYLLYKAEFDKAGKDLTVTFDFPSTPEDLPGFAGRTELIESFLNNPSFIIVNQSILGGNTEYGNPNSYLIIKKVEFGF